MDVDQAYKKWTNTVDARLSCTEDKGVDKSHIISYIDIRKEKYEI